MSKQLKAANARIKDAKLGASITAERTGRKAKAATVEALRLVGNAAKFGGSVVAGFFRGVRS